MRASDQEIQQIRTILQELAKDEYVGSEPLAAAARLVHAHRFGAGAQSQSANGTPALKPDYGDGIFDQDATAQSLGA